MTEDMLDLARRAVACKGWRWREGMRALPCSLDSFGLRGVPVRVVRVYDGDGILVWGDVPGGHSGSWEEWRWREEGRLPDLTDPATLGCVLALVRESWDGELLCVAFDYEDWEWAVRLWNGSSLTYGKGRTEAEALVAALEAAP